MLDHLASVGIVIVVWVVAVLIGSLVGLVAQWACSIPPVALISAILSVFTREFRGFLSRPFLVIWWVTYLVFAFVFIYWEFRSAYSSRLLALQVPWVQRTTHSLFAVGVLGIPNYLLWAMWSSAKERDAK